MTDRFVMSCRQAAELDFALERNDWTPDDVKWLSSGDTLARVLAVRRGTHEIRALEHALDLTTTPALPFSRAEIIEHNGTGVVRLERRGDNLYLDGKKVELHLSPKQKKGRIGGHDLRTYLEGRPVLNAAVLDYLLAHPELIPESWKRDEADNTRYIFFWGTIYRGADGNLYVRFLCWSGGRWVSDCSWLVSDWRANCLSAVLASQVSTMDCEA